MNRCAKKDCRNFVAYGFKYCRRNDCTNLRGEEE